MTTEPASKCKCRPTAILGRDGNYRLVTICDWHRNLEAENVRQAEEIRQLKMQLQFTPAFVDTLGTLGFPERFLEEYREQKMKIRRLTEQLKVAVEALKQLGHYYYRNQEIPAALAAIAALEAK